MGLPELPDDPAAITPVGTALSHIDLVPVGRPTPLPGSSPRYVIERIDGSVDEILVHLKEPGSVTARFRFNRKKAVAEQIGPLTTENKELAAEGRLASFVGRNRLANARERATQYFQETRATASKRR